MQSWKNLVHCPYVPQAFSETGLVCGQDYDVLHRQESSIFVRLTTPLPAWKATWYLPDDQMGQSFIMGTNRRTVTKLEIPSGSQVHLSEDYGTYDDIDSSKLRASQAKILEHQLHPDHVLAGQDVELQSTRSLYSCKPWESHCSDVYTVGALFEPNGFSLKPEVCAQGVHFFATEERARQYEWQ